MDLAPILSSGLLKVLLPFAASVTAVEVPVRRSPFTIVSV